MMKPIMNLDDVEFDDIEENGLYTSKRGQISEHILSGSFTASRRYAETKALV